MRFGKTKTGTKAFTMIEIAISLAVIGFALVAIIGILPTGMNVQRDNRQETVIVQDSSIFLSAIRNGAKGLDDLTNYVVAITNYFTEFNELGVPNAPGRWGYTYTNSMKNGSGMSPEMPLTNGWHIVGLLSTPKYVPFQVGPVTWVRSNYIVATVRSFSGPAGEKYPQNNPAVQELGFGYRVYPELVPYINFDREWTNFSIFPTNSPEYTARSNFWLTSRSMQTNLYDLRLRFRWPLLPNGGVGNGQQIFRTLVGGHLLGPTNEPWYPPNDPAYSLYIFQPRHYAKAQ